MKRIYSARYTATIKDSLPQHNNFSFSEIKTKYTNDLLLKHLYVRNKLIEYKKQSFGLSFLTSNIETLIVNMFENQGLRGVSDFELFLNKDKKFFLNSYFLSEELRKHFDNLDNYSFDDYSNYFFQKNSKSEILQLLYKWVFDDPLPQEQITVSQYVQNNSEQTEVPRSRVKYTGQLCFDFQYKQAMITLKSDFTLLPNGEFYFFLYTSTSFTADLAKMELDYLSNYTNKTQVVEKRGNTYETPNFKFPRINLIVFIN